MTAEHCQTDARRPATGVVAAAMLAGAISVSAFAQGVAEQTPQELKGVEIVANMGAQVPLDLGFTDDDGNEVTLGDYINGDKPIILTPVYFNCPQLCTLVLNGLVDGLEDVEMSVGTEFDIVTYSFAEEETTELANRKKRAYLTQYTREGAADGWHFLTGSKESITELSDTIGFKFKRQPNGEIAHSASIVFLTPDGRISAYMNDVLFKPRDIRLALVDASEGTISAPFEQFLLFTCFRYDPNAGSFVPSAWKIMRFFGGLTVVVLAAAVFLLFRMEAKNRREATPIPGLRQDQTPIAEGGFQS